MSYDTIKRFVDLLVTRAGRTLDDIIVDPGLAPSWRRHLRPRQHRPGYDAAVLRRSAPPRPALFRWSCRTFAWGTPKAAKPLLERAYLTLAARVGLDYALANVEANSLPLPADDPLVSRLEQALHAGRAGPGESVEDAGFRQAEKVMEICSDYLGA
jgi:hypothetical protein